jgi:hypothetical protein
VLLVLLLLLLVLLPLLPLLPLVLVLVLPPFTTTCQFRRTRRQMIR